ncbi:MAG: PIN domain-containing protein [Patescibacteria group bacterium]
MKEIILDTCVIIDIFEKTRPRHEKAKKVSDWIIENNVSLVLPITSRFEIDRTLVNIQQQNGILHMQDGITKERPHIIKEYNVDVGFFQKYFDPSLPYIKAGDYILMAMAKKDKLPLITEDTTLYNKSKEAGVEVFTEEEFLQNIA